MHMKRTGKMHTKLFMLIASGEEQDWGKDTLISYSTVLFNIVTQKYASVYLYDPIINFKK